MLKEFKEFISRGNVVDMAIGVIVGGAFGKIVSSLVNDIIMPPIGLALGGLDFKDLAITLKRGVEAVPASNGMPAVDAVPAVQIKYGLFFNTALDFLIIAFVIFLAIKSINAMKRPVPAPSAAPTTKDCPKCCSTIPIAATRCPNCTSDLK